MHLHSRGHCRVSAEKVVCIVRDMEVISRSDFNFIHGVRVLEDAG